MHPAPSVLSWRRHCLAAAAALLLAAVAQADDDVAAVFATASPGYHRNKGPDGKFVPETFVFGEGGLQNPSGRDASLDDLKFLQVATQMVGPLQKQGYVQARDPEKTQLLIMVYWGKTAGAASMAGAASYGGMKGAMMDAYGPAPTMVPVSIPTGRNGMVTVMVPATRPESALSAADGALGANAGRNTIRDRMNTDNARLLGYLGEMIAANDTRMFGPGKTHWEDLINELEEDRYYVVLIAYDFPQLWKEKKKVQQWVTRFSVRAHGNGFDEKLAAMVAQASRFFGQDSKGLIRDLRLKEQVDLGELKVVGHDDPK